MESFKDIWKLRNRGARDSARHRDRIKEAIKENLKDLIAEENIISSKGNKKIKVPVKYLDMYRFKFGKNKNFKGIGQGPGQPGDVIAKENPDGEEGKAGDSPGEEIYEEEIEISEVIEMMLEDLNLPWLERKESAVEIETEETVFQDIAERGLPSNIDKRRTVIENMKRNAMKGKMKIGGFDQSDLRYRIWDNVVENHSNAAVFLLMDRSGSMTSDKKYIVKSFFWWMVKFLEKKYSNVQLIFIAHDTEARQVEEENFFTIAESGGTAVSSAFVLAKKIIDEKYPTSSWNNYVFEFSDGDNWGDDNNKCLVAVKQLLKVCQAVGYGEVKCEDFDSLWAKSSLSERFRVDPDLQGDKRFISVSIKDKDEVYDCLKEFLGSIGEKE